ncbi:hypothetical protein M9435_004915 [Picochlorum sp. BPE23]|nr:hypothetical protein M9435_004915 [Picochlorum sp. BPE23]
MESRALSFRENSPLEEEKKHDESVPQGDLWYATLAEVARQIMMIHSEPGITVDASQASCVSEPWPETQWQTAFKILVFEMPTALQSSAAQKDDLVFLLDTRKKRVITRRRKKDPSALLDEFSNADDVIDWKASVMMYIIMHTTFRFSAMVDTVKHLDSRIQSAMKCSGMLSCPSGEVSRTTTAHSVLPTEAVFRESSAYPDIVFLNLEDTLDSSIVLGRDMCFACVLGADVQHSWGVSSRHQMESSGHRKSSPGIGTQVFSGYVTFDQMYKATEDNVAHNVVNKLQKLNILQGADKHPATRHTLDLRGYQDSGIAHVSASRILQQEGRDDDTGIEISVKDLHMYTFEFMAVQICRQICEMQSKDAC